EFADRYLARGHDPVEGSRNRGVAEIDFRRLHVGLRLEHVGARGVAVRACLVEIGLGRDVLGLKLLLAGGLRLRVGPGAPWPPPPPLVPARAGPCRAPARSRTKACPSSPRRRPDT